MHEQHKLPGKKIVIWRFVKQYFWLSYNKKTSVCLTGVSQVYQTQKISSIVILSFLFQQHISKPVPQSSYANQGNYIMIIKLILHTHFDCQVSQQGIIYA